MDEHLSGCNRAMDEEVECSSNFGVEVRGDALSDTGYGAAGTLLNLAKEWHCDLIVLGSRPRKGLTKLLSGRRCQQGHRGRSVPYPVGHGITAAIC